jgi:cyclic pyranopterin phosphate synthase
MVDVGAKAETVREAVARGEVRMRGATLRLVAEGTARKGDVLTVAQIAGIAAAKRTWELIPLCHPIPLTGVDVALAPDAARGRIVIEARVRTRGRTGAEMEALAAVAAAALTVYDMVKAVERGASIEGIRLVRKSGGKSGAYVWNGVRR